MKSIKTCQVMPFSGPATGAGTITADEVVGDRKEINNIEPIDYRDQNISCWDAFCLNLKGCPGEDWTKNKTNPPEFEGLNCNWVSDHFLVMQRPSSRLFRDFSLRTKFKVLSGIIRTTIY